MSLFIPMKIVIFHFKKKNHSEKFNSVEEKQSYKEKDDEKLY
jgi:hypothetical protein